jgi:hypothetical protein
MASRVEELEQQVADLQARVRLLEQVLFPVAVEEDLFGPADEAEGAVVEAEAEIALFLWFRHIERAQDVVSVTIKTSTSVYDLKRQAGALLEPSVAPGRITIIDDNRVQLQDDRLVVDCDVNDGDVLRVIVEPLAAVTAA